MTEACPRCGFSYQWNGTRCRRCNPSWIPRPAQILALLPTVPSLHRWLGIAACAWLGAFLFATPIAVLGFWEAFNWGDHSQLGEWIDRTTSWGTVFAGAASTGFLFGGVLGWSVISRTPCSSPGE